MIAIATGFLGRRQSGMWRQIQFTRCCKTALRGTAGGVCAARACCSEKRNGVIRFEITWADPFPSECVPLPHALLQCPMFSSMPNVCSCSSRGTTAQMLLACPSACWKRSTRAGSCTEDKRRWPRATILKSTLAPRESCACAKNSAHHISSCCSRRAGGTPRLLSSTSCPCTPSLASCAAIRERAPACNCSMQRRYSKHSPLHACMHTPVGR